MQTGEASPARNGGLSPQGIEVISSTPEEFQARLKEGIIKWAKVVQDAKIKPE